MKEGCAEDNISQPQSDCSINKIRVVDVGGVGAFGMLLSNEQLTDILDFLNVKTKRVLFSLMRWLITEHLSNKISVLVFQQN